jgi:hypothetical protein
MTNTCNSCGATYTPIQRDGSRYFHACGPIPNPAYQPDATQAKFDPRVTIERPNKRDENITGTDPVTQQPIMVSAGLGTTVTTQGA